MLKILLVALILFMSCSNPLSELLVSIFISPKVLICKDHQHELYHKELFAPILTIYPYKDIFKTNAYDALNLYKKDLNIYEMMKAAKLFEGEHHFHKYCTKPSENTIFKRTINSCEIVENNILTASFFPEKSYILKVRGKGFLRYQIRLMMATLFELGKRNLDLQFIEASLKENNDRKFLRNIAPSSGLQLFDIELNSEL